MSPIALARALRAHGWRYSRLRKGVAVFGVRFANGFGVTRVVDLTKLRLLKMQATELAMFMSSDAGTSAGLDFRSIGGR